MILANVTSSLPSGTVGLQVRDDGQFDFFFVHHRPKNTIFLDLSGPTSTLPAIVAGIKICFDAIPMEHLKNSMLATSTAPEQSPPDPTAPPPQ